MASKEIDIEELHSEILAAETYLKAAAKNEAAGDAARRSLDLRKSDILLQMGRKPLSSGSLTASMEAQAQTQTQAQASTRQPLDNDAGEEGAGGPDRWTQYDDGDDEDEHHFQDAHNSPDSIDPRRRRSVDEDGSVGYIDPANRYSDPAEREALISRLLAEHRSGKQGDAAPSSSQRAHAASSYHAYESRGSSESRYGADSDEDEDGGGGSEVAELFYASDLVGDGAAASSAAGYSLYAGGVGLGQGAAGAGGDEGDPLESMATLRVRQAWGSKPSKRSGAWASDKAQPPSSAPALSSSSKPKQGSQSRPQPQQHRRPELMKTIRPSRGAAQAQAHPSESAGAGRRLKSREELVLEAEGRFNDEFRFTPSITAKASNVRRQGPSSVADRIAEMNEKHRRALLEREATRREGERAELRDCTFKPQLAKKTIEIIDKKAKAESALRGESPPPPPPKPPRPSAAASAAVGGSGYLATMGGDHSSSSASGAGAGAGADIASRLHNEARVREAQFRVLQQRVQEARMSEYTFQPQLETSSSSAAAGAGGAGGAGKVGGPAGNLEQRPIFERVAEEQRFRSKRLADLRASYEEIQEQQLTFNPKIDPHSKSIVKQILPESEASKPAGDRLFGEQKRQQKRQQQRLMQHERELSENSKQPLPCRGSERIVERRGLDKQPFDRRQESHQRLLQDKADSRRREAEAEAATMFKPSIGRSEAIALASRPSLSAETEEERCYRLSTLDGAEIAAHRAEIEKEVYKDLTFRPAIDPLSQALGKRSSLQELVSNPKGQLVRQRAKEAQDRVVASECSFHPAVKDYVIDVNASSSSGGAAGRGGVLGYFVEASVGGWGEAEGEAGEKENMSRSVNVTSSGVVRAKVTPREPERLSRDIRLHLQEKEERRRAELIAREMESLRECSFAPSLPPPPPNTSDAGPVIVRGLGRHLELQHNAIKLKNDKNEREKQVFSVRGVDQLRRQEDGGTIVRPFSLSASSGKQSSAVVELMEVAQAQCTFAPVTTHVLRRETIGRQARAVF